MPESQSMKKILFTIFLTALTFLDTLAQSNEAYIEQAGSFHEASIEQAADDETTYNYNGSFPGQGVDGVPPGQPFQDNNSLEEAESFAEIFQFNSRNLASILQSGNHWAKTYQDGLNNIAFILQEGSGGGVSFNPPGVSNPCPPPFAPCDASSDEGSVASIYQEGDRNSANIEQNRGSNEAKIVQYGSDLEAIIHQFGDNNFASILQDFRGLSSFNNPSGFRTAEIEQTNSNNIATVEQSVPTSLPIQIIQDGNMEIHVEHHTP